MILEQLTDIFTGAIELILLLESKLRLENKGAFKQNH